ncbi:hypothetical protein GOODEAATRI_028471 [Goodea atripinnis]|uniref:Uncharacterized protein n=1 Tax=Goodea atripinnis TaxID=208336 RepID=A0ABV0NEE9_9TELE
MTRFIMPNLSTTYSMSLSDCLSIACYSTHVRVLHLCMDPVQKAVINHTFGVPQPLKKKQIISCNICHLRFNSTVRKASLAS